MKTIDQIRHAKFLELLAEAGGVKAMADRLAVSSAQVSQIKNQSPHSATGKPRTIGDEQARKIEKAFGRPNGWMDSAGIGESTAVVDSVDAEVIDATGRRIVPGRERDEIQLSGNVDFPAVRRVRFKLSAGASGFAVDYIGDDDEPIVFRRGWFEARGFDPAKLLAVRVINCSMEPGICDGDTVIVNTGDATPKDGEVFAVNFEGELVIKRLVRDAGQWWLSSDNPDQRRHPRKVCDEKVFLLGRVVHKQSEHI